MKATSVLAGVRVGAGCPVRIMAVINVSAESFYSGSVQIDPDRLREAARQAVDEGADFIDLGGMSTAPYLPTSIPEAEELRRVEWALDALRDVVAVPISIDTTRASVAAAAIAGGAAIVNDVSGLSDARMVDVAAQAEGLVVVASAPGAVVNERPIEVVLRLLRAALEKIERAGVSAQRLVIDPGIGFFPQSSLPTHVFNCTVISELDRLAELARPVLVGISRKSFIGKLTGRVEPDDRLAGSLGATAVAVYRGAAIVRTHDVRATLDAVRVAEAIRAAPKATGAAEST